MRRYKPRGEQHLNTCLEIGDGEYYNNVDVYFEVERPEPDVNFHGGIVLNRVMADDKDLMLVMTDKEQDLLAEHVIDVFNSYGEDDYL